jgi:sugar/nucleoside kinase (ribokinase family)
MMFFSSTIWLNAMAKEFVATVMGDLNVELVCPLYGYTFPDIDQDTLLYRAITCYVGGTAANFALAGLDYYRELHVVGKVGADALGTMIIDQLITSGIRVHCGIDDNAPTGLALHLRDANTSRAKGTRLLVVQAHSANRALSAEDVERYAHVITQSDVLVLDGYCLLDQPRRDASIRAMQIARAENVVIAFDIVPHNAYRLYNLDTLKSVVTLSDVLITEVGTIRHFLGLTVPDSIIDEEIALATAKMLQAEFKDKVFLLRFGIGNCDQSLVCVPNMTPRHSFTGYSQAEELRGFGDRLSARELVKILPLLKEGMAGQIRGESRKGI